MCYTQSWIHNAVSYISWIEYVLYAHEAHLARCAAPYTYWCGIHMDTYWLMCYTHGHILIDNVLSTSVCVHTHGCVQHISMCTQADVLYTSMCMDTWTHTDMQDTECIMLCCIYHGLSMCYMHMLYISWIEYVLYAHEANLARCAAPYTFLRVRVHIAHTQYICICMYTPREVCCPVHILSCSCVYSTYSMYIHVCIHF